MKNTFQLFTTFLAIQNLDNKVEILALLQRHKNDILETNYFSAVNILELEDKNSVALMLIPKSPDSWKQYNTNPGPKILGWFGENLLNTNLVQITSTWKTEVEVPVAIVGEV